MKNKSQVSMILALIAAIFIAGAVFCFSPAVHAQYNYTQLEKIPGSESSGSDLKSYIESIYRFAIWAVGIAAVLMITIGGFMYLTSAGNTSKMDIAKRVVTDAIIGLVVALSAYLILYVINPDLIKINLSMTQLGTGGGAGSTSAPKEEPKTGGTCNDGKCTQAESAITNNSSGIDAKLMKAIVQGGEGCNSANSPKGACGYSQVMPLIRKAYCNNVSCEQLRADMQLDINCGAAFIKNEITKVCNGNAKCTGACYNAGVTKYRKNNSICGENNYCTRVENYFNSCK